MITPNSVIHHHEQVFQLRHGMDGLLGSEYSHDIYVASLVSSLAYKIAEGLTLDAREDGWVDEATTDDDTSPPALAVLPSRSDIPQVYILASSSYDPGVVFCGFMVGIDLDRCASSLTQRQLPTRNSQLSLAPRAPSASLVRSFARAPSRLSTWWSMPTSDCGARTARCCGIARWGCSGRSRRCGACLC